MPTNTLAVSLGYISMIWGLFVSKISRLFLHHKVPLHLIICGNSRYLFSKCCCETGKYATLTGHLNFHFPLLAVSYKLIPRNQRKLDFFSIEPNSILQFTSGSPCELLAEKEQLSGHYAAYFEVAGMCYTTWCMWLHYVHFENHWKCLAERLLVLQTCVSHTL